MTTELAKATSLSEVPYLIQSLEQRRLKVAAFAESLKKEVANGINPEVDTKIEKFIVAAKDAKADFNKQRTPITKRLDEIKKMFTEKENAIQSLIDEFTKVRNDYAAQVFRENEARRIEAQKAQLKSEERIRLYAEIEVELRSWVQNKVDALKKSILKGLETVTAENASARLPKLQNMNVHLDHLEYGNFETKTVSKYGNSVEDINADVVNALEKELIEYYNKEMETYKHEAILQFNAIVKMDSEQKKEALEHAKSIIDVEGATALEVAKVQAEQQADASIAENTFNAIADETEAPESRSGFEIIIHSKEGYAALVAYWFAVLGKEFDGNWDTKTIGSMVGDLERYAHKNGEFLKSTAIEYKPVFKAINKKR